MNIDREILLPCGRIVQGHPMEANPVKDRQGNPKLNTLGEPRVSFYIAVAIQKGQEQHWSQTEWGALIYQSGVENWPNGQYQHQSFAWKVVDGDSTQPDKNGTPWNQKEGFPGHWVVKMSQGFPYPCYHAGKYQPHEVIKNKNEIKCGDYVRVQVKTTGNGSNDSPGIYINPIQLELSRAGQQIISQSVPDASAAFGASQAVLPSNAMIDNAVQPQPGMVPQGQPQHQVNNIPQPQTQNVAPGQVVAPPAVSHNTAPVAQPADVVHGNNNQVIPNPNYTNPQP